MISVLGRLDKQQLCSVFLCPYSQDLRYAMIGLACLGIYHVIARTFSLSRHWGGGWEMGF